MEPPNDSAPIKLEDLLTVEEILETKLPWYRLSQEYDVGIWFPGCQAGKHVIKGCRFDTSEIGKDPVRLMLSFLAHSFPGNMSETSVRKTLVSILTLGSDNRTIVKKTKEYVDSITRHGRLMLCYFYVLAYFHGLGITQNLTPTMVELLSMNLTVPLGADDMIFTDVSRAFSRSKCAFAISNGKTPEKIIRWCLEFKAPIRRLLTANVRLDQGIRPERSQMRIQQQIQVAPSAPPSEIQTKPRLPPPEETDNEALQCQICFRNKINCSIAPCGHTGCSLCMTELKACHICRQSIVDLNRVYL